MYEEESVTLSKTGKTIMKKCPAQPLFVPKRSGTVTTHQRSSIGCLPGGDQVPLLDPVLCEPEENSQPGAVEFVSYIDHKV